MVGYYYNAKGGRYSSPPQPSLIAICETKTDCSSYETNIQKPEEIKRLIAENGFVIVKDVLTQEECKMMIDGMWSSFEQITADMEIPINRNREETWKSFKELEATRHIYNQYGISHAEFLWQIRQNENILAIFSLLYHCKPTDLLVSFDGISIQTPPEQSRSGWFRKVWYHVDSSFNQKNKDIQSYQSWVTGLDVLPGDFTTGFFVGSHKSFEEFGKRFTIEKKENFYKLQTQEELDFYESKFEPLRISCKRGSLVVWDSRLLHTGMEPMKGRNYENSRMICFLSYSPLSECPMSELKKKQILRKRVKLYKERRATTHWTHACLKTVGEGKTKKGLKKLETRPNETDSLKRLVGFSFFF